jgi:hypothetical protein
LPAAGAIVDADALTVDIAKVTQRFKEGDALRGRLLGQGTARRYPMRATFAWANAKRGASAVQATRRGERAWNYSGVAPRMSRITVLAAKLIDLNVDVIVVTGFQASKKMPAMNVRRFTAVVVPDRR